MEIYGLQKLTLLDYPNTRACSIFLGGCPFRCPYCHNYELVDGSAKPIMTEEELFDFLRVHAWHSPFGFLYLLPYTV